MRYFKSRTSNSVTLYRGDGTISSFMMERRIGYTEAYSVHMDETPSTLLSLMLEYDEITWIEFELWSEDYINAQVELFTPPTQKTA